MCIQQYIHHNYIFRVCSLSPVWPQNQQLRSHFGDFLKGYRSSAESIECTFPHADSSRVLNDFSVCFADGFSKVLLCTAIVCFIHELEAQLCEVTLSV